SLGAGQHSVATKKFHHYIRVLCNTVKKQKAEINDLKKTVEDLKQKQGNDNEKSGVSWSELVGGGIGEEGEEEDKTKVDEVLKILKMDRSSVKSQRRISWKKKNTDNSGKTIDKIIVEFKDLIGKQTAMKNASNLRDSSFKHVFINPDKTSDERELEYKLRKERNERNDKLPEGDGRHRYGTKNGRKFYWGIRFNKLKEIYIEC
ncbi:hypothetical protein BpHYR1_006396, partial [Brachionus plicatilis]